MNRRPTPINRLALLLAIVAVVGINPTSAAAGHDPAQAPDVILRETIALPPQPMPVEGGICVRRRNQDPVCAPVPTGPLLFEGGGVEIEVAADADEAAGPAIRTVSCPDLTQPVGGGLRVDTGSNNLFVSVSLRGSGVFAPLFEEYVLAPHGPDEWVEVTACFSSLTIFGRSPRNIAPPSVTGEPREGQTLTAHGGQWEGQTEVQRRWLRCGDDGCTGVQDFSPDNETYVLTQDDVGHTVKVEERARNGAGYSYAQSAAAGPVLPLPPGIIARPEVSGEPRSGHVLTAIDGQWDEDDAVVRRRWLRCGESGCTDPPFETRGAANATYALSDADVGHTIKIQERAENAGGATHAESDPVGPVLPLPPTSVKAPAITGVPREGRTLTASNGEWHAHSGPIQRRWLRCTDTGCNDPPFEERSASNATYTLAEADVSHTIKVQERASNDGGSAEAESDPVGPVLPLPPKNVTLPALTGSAREGRTLTATDGAWERHTGQIQRRWLRCHGTVCTDPPFADRGPANAQYVLTEEDVDHVIVVQERASNPGGAMTAASHPSGTVQPAVVHAHPSSVDVTAGSLESGGLDALRADDGQYLVVASTGGRHKTAAWTARFDGIPNELDEMTVRYVGKSSKTCTQSLRMWRWSTSEWITFDSRALDTTEASVQVVVAHAPADYVSGTSGPGEVHIGVSCVTGNSFHLSGELLQLSLRPH